VLKLCISFDSWDLLEAESDQRDAEGFCYVFVFLTSPSPHFTSTTPFQLTVNCSALIICFVGAVAINVEPLNILQLLWVNLIMDVMGALALATEPPSPDLLKEKPNGPDTPLISWRMWKHILIQGLWQVRRDPGDTTI
jgi:hypothetical protein